MAYTAPTASYLTADVPPRTAALQRSVMWAAGASGAVVFIEPSPYELVVLTGVVLFYATGMKMRPVFLPLLFLLVVVNLGYSIGSVSLLDQGEILNWVLTSWYMAITAIFFAMALSDDTFARLDYLRRGLVFGAVIASAAAIAGYFNLVPGGRDLLTLYDRARGTFKDPNVLGAYLILPALFALQNIITQSFWKAFRSALAFGIMAIAVLLAFSRASWGQLILTSMFMIGLMYLTSASTKERRRIVTITIAAIALAALTIAILLSMESVSNLFKERASFNQSYDTGRFGRFGRHALGFQMALELPLGIGPLQFRNYFPEDTHNSFLNAFMSGGWISGLCYPVLMFVTLLRGFRLIFVPVPWQRLYLALFSAFLGTVVEAFIIDVDHWRHFWMMVGAMWAMFAACDAYMKSAYQPILHSQRPDEQLVRQ